MDNTGFSVDVLCELHHMSRTSFYCKLKALTGQSPTDLIRITRLKRATQLLKRRWTYYCRNLRYDRLL